MAAGLPTLVVEVAFTSDSLDTTPTWVDITSYVRAGSIRSGRTNELDEFQTGSCALTLDNRTRRFDPLYASGPYYGNLKARRQCRIRATYSAVTYDLFYGFVSGWSLSPDLSGDSVCQIEGYDGLSYLAGVDLLPDYFTNQAIYYAEYLSYGLAWWPLGSDTSQCVDKLDQYNWTFTTAQPQTGSVPSQWMQGNGTRFDGTNGAIGPLVPPAGGNGEWSVSGFINTTEFGPSGFVNPILCNAGPVNATIGVDSTGRLVFRNSSAGAANSGFPINDGNWHFFTVSYSGFGAAPKIYVDGFDLTFDATGSGANGTGWNLLGLSNHVGDSVAFTGELAHIQIYDKSLAREISSELYQAGIRGIYVNAATGADMLANVILSTDWPDVWGLNFFEASTVQYGGVKWGQSALTVLQQLALTEGGRIFVDQAGILQFYNRSHDFTATRSTTSQATYSDSGAAGVVPFFAVGEISFSDEYLANKVTVKTANDTAYTVQDATSITTYGMVAKEIDTSLASLADAQTYGAIYLNKYKEPNLRIQEWKVSPQAKGSVAFPKILDARLADRVTFEILPNSVGSRISQDLIVEQISHDFTPETWTTTFSGSPATAAWLLEDATYGLLESTTILG